MSLRTPKLRLHKPSGLAVVTLSGHDFYCGKYGSPESRAEYDRLIAEWLSNGRKLSQQTDLTVNELCIRYLAHAETYYRDEDGVPTNEYHDTKLSVKQFRHLYGHTLAKDFGPLALKAVREQMIRDDLSRGVINQRIGRIVRCFKWSTENELVPPSVYQALRAVSGLRAGRTNARECEPVRPVPTEHVNAIKSHVSELIWSIIQVQLLSGARPGEILQMRTADIDMTGDVWLYRPRRHKNRHRGHQRNIPLGPRAQLVLKPWLRPDDPDGIVFSPRIAMERLSAEKRAARKSPVQPSQRNRNVKNPKRRPREAYTVTSYRKAVERGCQRAKIPVWSPHRLRHNAGTTLRKQFGLDVARATLGHRTAKATEIYAEIDYGRAEEAAKKIG